MAVTVSDVEDLSSKSWQQLDATKKQNLLDMAEREATTIYSDRVATLPTIEGNTDDFIKLLAAHLWTLSSGGETQSESATGGSVNYNTVTGESIDTLSQTRYGRQAKSYLRDKAGIGIVRTR